ncbi:unnamed protein product [marine sediment metagenome]|uniref:Uncharacterized protein n=1 Tax=marine sediment metagenome TaxID=412755 RepID=X1MY16_9ZZZZ
MKLGNNITIQYGKLSNITIQYGKIYDIFLLSEPLYLHTIITILYVPTYLYKSLTYIRPKHKTTTQHTNTLFSKGMGI